MARIVAAYIAGALSAFVLMALLNGEDSGESDRARVGSVNDPALSEGPTSPARDGRAQTAGRELAAAGSNSEASTAAPTLPAPQVEAFPAALRSSGDERATREAAARAGAGAAAEPSQDPDDDPEDRAAARVPELPVSHEPLVNDTPLEDDLAALQAEERDEAWAATAEPLLYSHVAGHPAGREIGLLAVLCRQTQCWVVGTAYGENGRANWEAVRNDFRSQPWFATYFAGIVGDSSAAASDGHRFVTMFLRAGYQPESLFPE